MPIYLWDCGEHNWEVTTTMSARNDQQLCPKCQLPGVRRPTLPRLSATLGDWNKAEYNPGLGKVTYGQKDRERKAKEMGLEEVGTTSAEAFEKEAAQTLQAKREAVWNDVTREKVYE